MNIQKITFLYIRYENLTNYYVLNTCTYDDLKTIFGLLLLLSESCNPHDLVMGYMLS